MQRTPVAVDDPSGVRLHGTNLNPDSTNSTAEVSDVAVGEMRRAPIAFPIEFVVQDRKSVNIPLAKCISCP